MQIFEKNNFRKETFCGLVTLAARKDTTLPNFAENTFANIPTKLRNWRKFSPSKVSRYTVLPIPAVGKHSSGVHCVYTQSVSNSWHIETVYYHSI